MNDIFLNDILRIRRKLCLSSERSSRPIMV